MPRSKKTPPLKPMHWQVLRDIEAGRGAWHDMDDRHAVQGRCYVVFDLYQRGLTDEHNALRPAWVELLAAAPLPVTN